MVIVDIQQGRAWAQLQIAHCWWGSIVVVRHEFWAVTRSLEPRQHFMHVRLHLFFVSVFFKFGLQGLVCSLWFSHVFSHVCFRMCFRMRVSRFCVFACVFFCGSWLPLRFSLCCVCVWALNVKLFYEDQSQGKV